jgi:hypothetical protein
MAEIYDVDISVEKGFCGASIGIPTPPDLRR